MPQDEDEPWEYSLHIPNDPEPSPSAAALSV